MAELSRGEIGDANVAGLVAGDFSHCVPGLWGRRREVISKGGEDGGGGREWGRRTSI